MLFQVFLWLSYVCNLKCEHCYAKKLKNNEYFHLDFVKKLIDDLHELWIIKVVLSHWEPFAYPYIFEILEYLKIKWFHIVVMSNWILLNKEKINRLEKIWLDKIFISLDSLDENIYDNFRWVKWSYKKVIKCFKLLWDSKLKWSIASTISELNKNELHKIIDFAVQKWAHEISMLTIRNNSSFLWLLPKSEYKDIIRKIWLYYKSKHKKNIELLLHDKLIFWFLEGILENNEKELIKNQNECVVWTRWITIAPDGNVYPCNFVYQKMWNVYEKNIIDIFNDNKNKKFKSCITCKN